MFNLQTSLFKFKYAGPLIRTIFEFKHNEMSSIAKIIIDMK